MPSSALFCALDICRIPPRSLLPLEDRVHHESHNEAIFSTLLENGAGFTEREYHDHDSRRSGKDARTFDRVGDRRDVDARLLSIDADAHWHVGRSAGGGKQSSGEHELGDGGSPPPR